jgi:hypothetical protein
MVHEISERGTFGLKHRIIVLTIGRRERLLLAVGWNLAKAALGCGASLQFVGSVLTVCWICEFIAAQAVMDSGTRLALAR